MAAQKYVNNNDSGSSGQLLTRKLLRSIRRRNFRQSTGAGENATPKNKKDKLRRKLNFQANRKSMGLAAEELEKEKELEEEQQQELDKVEVFKNKFEYWVVF